MGSDLTFDWENLGFKNSANCRQIIELFRFLYSVTISLFPRHNYAPFKEKQSNEGPQIPLGGVETGHDRWSIVLQTMTFWVVVMNESMSY